jgi:hypothetical protein
MNLIILLELLQSNVSRCRELPFCPADGIRGALRIPSGAGVYRGIRANMEQTSGCTGLDHCAKASETQWGRGRGHRRQRYRRPARHNVIPRYGGQQEMSLRFVVPAGGASGPLVVVAPGIPAEPTAIRLVAVQLGRVIYDVEDPEFAELQEPVGA